MGARSGAGDLARPTLRDARYFANPDPRSRAEYPALKAEEVGEPDELDYIGAIGE